MGLDSPTIFLVPPINQSINQLFMPRSFSYVPSPSINFFYRFLEMRLALLACSHARLFPLFSLRCSNSCSVLYCIVHTYCTCTYLQLSLSIINAFLRPIYKSHGGSVLHPCGWVCEGQAEICDDDCFR